MDCKKLTTFLKESEAALVTTGVVTSAGGIAGAVAAVETASLSAGAFFTAISFLP